MQILDGAQCKAQPRHQERQFELEGSYIFQTWRLLGKATAYAKDKAGQIFIVRNRYGKGKAFLVGITLGNMYSKTASISDDIKRKETAAIPDAGRLFCDIVREAGIQMPEVDDTIRFHRLLLPEGRELHFYLNQSEQAASCKAYAPGKSLISKKPITDSVSLGKYGVEMLLT